MKSLKVRFASAWKFYEKHRNNTLDEPIVKNLGKRNRDEFVISQ